MKECYIQFFADVHEESFGSLLEILNAKHSEGYERIHLLMSSAGGSSDYGISLYNILKIQKHGELYTYNLGIVHSSAVLIFCAGTRRFAADSSSFLIHPVKLHYSATKEARLSDIREDHNILKDIEYNTAHIISQTTGKSLRQVQKDIESSRTFTSREAKDYGLVTHGIETPVIAAGAEVIAIFNAQYTYAENAQAFAFPHKMGKEPASTRRKARKPDTRAQHPTYRGYEVVIPSRAYIKPSPPEYTSTSE